MVTSKMAWVWVTVKVDRTTSLIRLSTRSSLKVSRTTRATKKTSKMTTETTRMTKARTMRRTTILR